MRLFVKTFFDEGERVLQTSFQNTCDDRAKISRITRFKISVQEAYRDIEFPWRSSAVDLPQRDIILSYANRGERGDNENLFRRFRFPCRACERCSLYLVAHANVSRMCIYSHLFVPYTQV